MTASRLEQARAAWGELPDWVEVLAVRVDATSQNRVAQDLRRSASLVSCVLSRTYRGSYAAAEATVRGVYMAGTVECPQLGTIPSNLCRDFQRRPYANVGGESVRMFRACRRCPLRDDRATPDEEDEA